MSNIWHDILAKREEPQSLEIEGVSRLTLFELSKRDIAIQVYSGFLNCIIWLCSNEEMAAQIKRDDPEAITYSVDEIMNLIKLNPDPDGLRRIHNAKEVFMNSKIVDCSLDGENHDK